MPDTSKTSYTILYALGMAFIVGTALSITAVALRPYQERNVRLEKMTYILRAVGFYSEDPNTIEQTYQQRVLEFVGTHEGKIEAEGPGAAFQIDVAQEAKKKPAERRLPVFVYKDEAGKYVYTVACYGRGLWGPIWGYVALEDDLATIHGVVFDHKSETPGLGAEIATPKFWERFKGVKAFDEKGRYILRVVKPGKAKGPSVVDGLSGATLTTKGLDAMLREWLPLYRPSLISVKEKLQKSAA